MSGYVPYIPNADAPFDNWFGNFGTLVVATPAVYGLVAADGITIQTLLDTWQDAYDAAINPTTRTPVTITAKDNAKAAALTIIRPYAQNIRNNAAVSDGLKIGLGLTVPSLTPTVIPPPGTPPSMFFISAGVYTHTLSYANPAAPREKAKPFGAIGMELQIQYTAIGVAPSGSAWTPYAVATKTPFLVTLDHSKIGMQANYRARWQTRGSARGAQFAQVSDWSAIVSFVVAA